MDYVEQKMTKSFKHFIKICPMRKQGMLCPLMSAYYEGEHLASCGKIYKNPYPKGYRHDAFKNGFITGQKGWR